MKEKLEKLKQKVKKAISWVSNKIKAIGRAFMTWALENPELFGKLVEGLVSIGVVSGLSALKRRRKEKAEMYSKSHKRMVYDRRTDTWSETKRPLKYKEKQAMEMYYRSGGMKSEWLFRKGLLKW